MYQSTKTQGHDHIQYKIMQWHDCRRPHGSQWPKPAYQPARPKASTASLGRWTPKQNHNTMTGWLSFGSPPSRPCSPHQSRGCRFQIQESASSNWSPQPPLFHLQHHPCYQKRLPPDPQRGFACSSLMWYCIPTT